MDEDGEIRRLEDPPTDDLIPDGECNALEFYRLSSEPPTTFKTLKIMGDLQGIPALILIDDGATHNFLSKQLALALGLEVHPMKPLSISLGDGSRIKIAEICHGVSIQLGVFNCTVDALVYDLGSLDAILGVAWLGTLGDVVFNWQAQFMRFWHQDTLVHLQGVGSPSTEPSSLKLWLDEQLLVFTAEVVSQPSLSDDQQVQLDALMHHFSSLFQPPQGLPPVRSIEHAINLRDGQGPICVRPYRYPHLHKDEIQRQVNEMLETGIIRVS